MSGATPLKKYLKWAWVAAAACVLLTGNLQAQDPVPKRFEKEILTFEKNDKTNPPPQGAILFVGSSSIRLWKTLAHDFPDRPVFNRGFGGSHISEVNEYVDRIVFPYHPRMIVFYAGTNDIADGKTPERVCNDLKRFVGMVREKLPETRIAYISLSPNPARWKMIDQIREANQRIADYVKTVPNAEFIDAYSQMLGEDGLPKPDIFGPDQLHMNEKGYALWTEIVAPYLK